MTRRLKINGKNDCFLDFTEALGKEYGAGQIPSGTHRGVLEEAGSSYSQTLLSMIPCGSWKLAKPGMFFTINIGT